ncbi:MAG: tetratricopeptide repeat protein [bacterium]
MLNKKIVIPALLLAVLTISSVSLADDTINADNPASRYFQNGISLFDQGDYDQALPAFQKATQEDPNYAEGYYNQGIIYDLQGRFTEAIEAYQKVIRLDPEVGTVLRNLAQDCYVTGRLREAMDYIKLAESLGQPVDKEFYNQIWAEYKGLKSRQTGGKTAPASGKGRIEGRTAGISHAESPEDRELEKVQRDIELDIISLEKELGQQETGKSGELINLGIKYRQKGEIDKSIDVLTRALSLSTAKMMIYAELGLCYYFKDRKDLFVQNFGQAKRSGFKPSRSLNDLYLQCLARK